MSQNPFDALREPYKLPDSEAPKSAAVLKAEADVALAKATADAAALLAELDAASPSASKYQMPSQYAPGESPRDPVQSIKNTMGTPDMSGFGDDDPRWSGKELPMSVTVDFASKIKNANKQNG